MSAAGGAWLIVPAIIIAAVACAAVASRNLRHKGQRAAPRAPRPPARHVLVPEPRRFITRAVTAGQPPAEITGAPCQEPPAAATWPAAPPVLRSDAPTVVIHPAIPAGKP